ncbi:MAG TPA: hypothetical protein EYG69_00075 [Campylobacterales bacterium]|nr:hypothetical protein [Campylobacterales bacterium]
MKRVVFSFLFALSLYANNNVGYDLVFLTNYAEENPDNIRARELLLTHYIKTKDRKNILKYSQQLHKIDPKNRVLVKLVKAFTYKQKIAKLTKEDATKVLKDFFKKEDYIRYINLYQALVDSNKNISKDSHVDALYSAVMLNKYKLAKNILKRDDLPMSPHLSSIMRMLDKKLASSQNL